MHSNKSNCLPNQIWGWYNTDPVHSHFGGTILLIFSLSNAASNVFSGVISDFLNTRHILKPNTFLAIIQFIWGGIFLIVGILFIVDSGEHTSTLLAGVLLASSGRNCMKFISRTSIWLFIGFIAGSHWNYIR